jgi:ribonuclease HII
MNRKSEGLPSLWKYDQEKQALLNGLCLVGVDEAGRGPLAGNVVAACVILDLKGEPLSGLNDSKKISENQRESLYPEILEKAKAYGIGEASPKEIDGINILQATFLAMARAIAAMRGETPQPGLGAKPLPEVERQTLFLWIDGNKTIPSLRHSQAALVKGDGLSASIAAASILAKVTRDRQLVELDTQYPQYGFAQHKGYPTEAHREAVRQLGLCPAHRRSFCDSLSEPVDLFA